MRASTCMVFGLACVAAGLAHAGKPIVYPAKGQSPQQQPADAGQCYAGAKGNTGIDPAAVAPPPTPRPPGRGGRAPVSRPARGARRRMAGGGIP